MGKWLGDLHEASRKFQVENPSEYEQFPSWDTKDGGWQKKDMKPPQLPMDAENFGLVHGDFHLGNVFCDKDKITGFDFDNLQKGYFITDLGAILFTVQNWVFRDNNLYKRLSKLEQLRVAR